MALVWYNKTLVTVKSVHWVFFKMDKVNRRVQIQLVTILDVV